MKRIALLLVVLVLFFAPTDRTALARDSCGDCMEAAQQASTAYYSACIAGGGDYNQCDYDSRTLKCAYGATHCGSCSWIDMLIESGFCLN